MTFPKGQAHAQPFRTIADALPSNVLLALLNAAMWGTKLRKELDNVRA